MPPSARVTDMHVCPMVSPGPVPHVGGPILPPGCPTVLVGCMPQARVGDMCVCVGPPDAIARGSPTVLVGTMMAARLGDTTVHGGVIVMGLPTVVIGESGSGGGTTGPGGLAISALPNGDLKVGKHIVISGSDAFKQKAVADLCILGNTKTGKDVLAALDANRHDVTLKELDMATARRNGALATRLNGNDAFDPAKGSATLVQYNPDLKAKYTDADGNEHDMPVQSTLGHELIHAVHNDRGTNERRTADPKEAGSNMEEANTIGINDRSEAPMSENNILKDLGAGIRRTDHD